MERSAPASEHDPDAPTIQLRVQEAMGDLTRAERRVGHALLTDYPLAGLETAAQLAERAGVSAPTVVRFATSIGFSGHAGLQAALFREVRAQRERNGAAAGAAEAVGAEADADGDPRQILLDTLSRTFDALSLSELEAAAELLADPRRPVLCLGGAGTAMLARLLADRALLARPCVEAAAPSGPAPPQLLDADRRTVVVVFDLRPHEPDTIAAARWARERKATIVLVTDPSLSPVVEVADHILTASVGAVSPFGSQVGAVALVELLLAEIVRAGGDAARQRLDDLQARGHGA